jgi:hypothetical protein
MVPRAHVIACDKREAFAQGSASDEAIQFFSLALDCFADARNDGIDDLVLAAPGLTGEFIGHDILRI